MLPRSPSTWALVAVIFIACQGHVIVQEAPQGIAGTATLINGTVVAAGDLPSTMEIADNCTVSKVGDHHILNASHCVRNPDGSVARDYRAGQSLTLITNAARGQDPRSRRVTVVQTTLHPALVQWCKTYSCAGGASDTARDAPDLAVIEIKETTPDIPVAAIDEEPLLATDAAVMVGYGCTDATLEYDGQLRRGPTQALMANAIIHPGSRYTANDPNVPLMAGTYVFTPGPGGINAASPGLCPGDSGGPLYRIVDGVANVVGVNSSYTFAVVNAPNGSNPVTNWHARVDTQARHEVLSWLKSLGVASVRSCDHASHPCPAAPVSAP